MTAWLILLLVLGPFFMLATWLIFDSRRSSTVEGTTGGDPARLRMQTRLTNVAGGLLLVGYCVALITGWLKPQSTADGLVIAAGMVTYVIFGTRASVRQSLVHHEAAEMRQARHALLFVITICVILGIAGWFAATRGIQ